MYQVSLAMVIQFPYLWMECQYKLTPAINTNQTDLNWLQTMNFTVDVLDADIYFDQNSGW